MSEAAPQTISRRRAIFPLLGNGIIAREARAALPVVTALTLMFCLYLAWAEYSVSFSPGPKVLAAHSSLLFVWLALSQVVAFVLGVLCGAEERESGTDQFLLTLPIARLRVMSEKIVGSLASFAIFVLLSFIAIPAVLKLFNPHLWAALIEFTHRIGPYDVPVALIQALFAFSVGLASGAWIGNVLIATIVGAVLSLFYGMIAYWFIFEHDLNHLREFPGSIASFFLPPFVLAIFLSAVRFTDGAILCGRSAAEGKRGLFWKEFREKRWWFLGATAGGVIAFYGAAFALS
jgi:hypothetical protein